jgi:hypothetical protein
MVETEGLMLLLWLMVIDKVLPGVTQDVTRVVRLKVDLLW